MTDARGSDDLEDRLRVALDEAGVPGVVSAYLFGSRAEGRSHRESDVDIGVLLDRGIHATGAERFDAGLRLSGRLQAALRTDPIDLVILNDAPPLLGRRIVTAGRRLRCSDAAADHAYRRDAQLRAADVEPFLRRARERKLAALAR
jgi:predicted nucleotidyltransferase